MVKRAITTIALLSIVLLLLPVEASSQDADRIIEKSNLASYYAADDGKAKARMEIKDRRGRTRVRELVMLRKDIEDGGRQNFYIYFTAPTDIKGMVFMVKKFPQRDDDRWLYIPAVDLIKRIVARDKRLSFAGSHFTYEDVSGRSPQDDTHTFLREERLGDKDTYVIKNTPKDKDEVEFSYYIVWIDKKTYLPLKAEYYDKKGRLYKVLKAEKIETIEGIPTAVRIKAEEVGGGTTVVEFTDIRYNLGIPDSIFTERYLRKVPRRWIR